MDCLLSSAAFWPISGLPPAPRPRVSSLPTWMWQFSGTAAVAMAWESVLTIQNSTPWMSLPTMRLTALEPPPPTPTTCFGRKNEEEEFSRGGERGGRSERAARPRDVSR